MHNQREHPIKLEVATSLFKTPLEKEAKRYINIYFADKAVFNVDLHKSRYIKMLFIDTAEGIEKIYQIIGVPHTQDQIGQLEKNGQIAEDIKTVMKMFDECSKLKVPKCFAAGLILMNLQIQNEKRVAA